MLENLYVAHALGTAARINRPVVTLLFRIRTFVQSPSEFGFFMDKSRFQAIAFSPNTSTISPSLVDTVCLWGNFIANPSSNNQAALLSRAIQSSSQAVSRLGMHPERLVQCIQAEVLLAFYFFYGGRTLEGRYHTCTAVSLILSSGLHQIRSSRLPNSSLLPPPRDAVEEGERINAFWTVFVLNNCWTTVDGTPSNIPIDTQIDTPWPLDLSNYVQVCFDHFH
jgi:hypothetical protein